MTDFTLAQRGLQDKSYLEGMRDMLGYITKYLAKKDRMPPKELIKEIQRVKLSHDTRKLEPYRKSETMLQMREIAQKDMEQDNE